MGVSSTYFYCDVGIEDGNSSCHHFVVSPFLKVIGAAEYLLIMMMRRRHCVEYDLHNVYHKHRGLLMCRVSSYIGKKVRSTAGLQEEQGRYLWCLSDSRSLNKVPSCFFQW